MAVEPDFVDPTTGIFNYDAYVQWYIGQYGSGPNLRPAESFAALEAQASGVPLPGGGGGAGTTPGGTPGGGGMGGTTEQQSAFEIIRAVLDNYGLSNLTNFVQQMVFQEDITSADVILGRIRQTKEYKDRFAANEQRRAKGLNALSEGEYISMERVYLQYFRQSGLPREMWDENKDVQTLISNDVSVAELAQRINQGYEAVRNSDPQVINEMRRLYGVTDDQLAAYFLDPEKATPVLLRQAQSAQIAGQARLQAGFELGMGQAEELAIAGVTQEQAQQGFQAIQQAQELFQTLPFEEEIGQAEQIAGVFGTSAAAQQRIRQRQRTRQGEFEQGGRFAGQGSTFTGLQ